MIAQIPGVQKVLDGPSVQQTYIFPRFPTHYWRERKILRPVRYWDGPSIVQTFPVPPAIPVNQPDARYWAPDINRAWLWTGPDQQLDGPTNQQSQVFQRFPVTYRTQRSILQAPQNLDGATSQQGYIFPVSQPLVALPQRQPILAQKYFDGAVVATAQTYIFPASQPQRSDFYNSAFYQQPNVVGPFDQLGGASLQQTFPIPPVNQPEFRYWVPDLNRAWIWNGPEQQTGGASIQQTYIFPQSQPQRTDFYNSSFYQQPGASGPADQLSGAAVQQTFPIPPTNQPEFRYWTPDINRSWIWTGPDQQLDGPVVQQTFIFPVSQPLIYLASRQAVGAQTYFEGSTSQQTYVFPVAQPDPGRIRLPEMLRFLVDAPKRLDGSTVQQTYVFPTNEPELRRFSELRRLDAIVDAPRYWYGFAAIQPQSYIFPVSQPLVYLGSRQPLNAPSYFEGSTLQQTFVFPVNQPGYPLPQPSLIQAVRSFDGTPAQQTYIFPLAQPQLLNRFDINRLVQSIPQFSGAAVQQQFLFPVSQPTPGYGRSQPAITLIDIRRAIQVDLPLPPIDLSQHGKLQQNRYIVETPKRFDGATVQQQFTFPLPIGLIDLSSYALLQRNRFQSDTFRGYVASIGGFVPGPAGPTIPSITLTGETTLNIGLKGASTTRADLFGRSSSEDDLTGQQ